MKYSALLVAALAVVVGVNAQAALITVNDGDAFEYDATNTYSFVAELSAANPMVTFGAIVDSGEAFNFVVTAPNEISLGALLTDTADAIGGITIVTPNFQSTVFAGMSFSFPINGDVSPGNTKWLTVAFDTIADTDNNGTPDYLDYLSSLPGGTLPVGEFLSSSVDTFTFFGGVSDDNGYVPDDPNGNGDGTSIPTPATLPMAILGLLLIGVGKLMEKFRRESSTTAEVA